MDKLVFAESIKDTKELEWDIEDIEEIEMRTGLQEGIDFIRSIGGGIICKSEEVKLLLSRKYITG